MALFGIDMAQKDLIDVVIHTPQVPDLKATVREFKRATHEKDRKDYGKSVIQTLERLRQRVRRLTHRDTNGQGAEEVRPGPEYYYTCRYWFCTEWETGGGYTDMDCFGPCADACEFACGENAPCFFFCLSACAGACYVPPWRICVDGYWGYCPI